MKTFGININGWFTSMFMFLTGKDFWNLPYDTCNLFWQSFRMFVLLPITFLGAVAMHVTGERKKENGTGGLWNRIGSTFLILMSYCLLFMLGDAIIGAVFMELTGKEMAISHLNRFAYIWLPLVGAIIIAIPLIVIAGIGVVIYHSFKFIKEEYQEAAEEHFGIEIDKETALPKNKFWAILYMIHDKTCAKIAWKN